MATTVAMPAVRTRPTIGLLQMLMMLGLLALSGAFGYVASLFGDLNPMFMAFIVVPIVLSALTFLGWRWWPAVVGVISAALLGLLVMMFFGQILPMFFHTLWPVAFIPTVGLTVAAITGILATVQNYTGSHLIGRSGPVIAGVAVGALALGLIVSRLPLPGAVAGYNQAALAQMPELQTKNFSFTQQEVRVKAGELVTMKLTNPDIEDHSFDIDEFGVHVPMLKDKTGLVSFVADTPGTYTFYCAPHYDAATGEGMKGTLIVE